MTTKTTIILLITVAAVSAGVTRYFFPQVQFRDVEVTKEVVKTDVKTVVRVIERPDGTKETVRETTDKSVKHETTAKEVTVSKKNDWMFDIGARKTLTDKDIYYDLQVQRRILGPFFLGAKVSTDKSVGLSVGMEF